LWWRASDTTTRLSRDLRCTRGAQAPARHLQAEGDQVGRRVLELHVGRAHAREVTTRDHYARGKALNPGCDGPTTACQYQSGTFGQPDFQRNVGEVNVNLPGLVSGMTGDNTVFAQNFDGGGRGPGARCQGGSGRGRDCGAGAEPAQETCRQEPLFGWCAKPRATLPPRVCPGVTRA